MIADLLQGQKIGPLEKSTAPYTEALANKLYPMLPPCPFPDRMSEVRLWHRIRPSALTHLRTGETVRDQRC
ncbi:MAG: hypothetical protein JOY71_00205 [Acetobacteraceae bacterium]|nr:hypothetical protein [Acetobacteraceae bacterium]